MTIIIALIIISLIVAVVFLSLFIWSVKSGQYDDTDSPAVRMLIDDTKPRKSKTTKN
ncbi:MAG: cbb3-type cytochrome oxidase assembly protein CcoS [Reichenbachiella sp.]